MAEKKNLKLMKITLILFAVLTLMYGLIYLFFPETYVKFVGSDPIPSAWIRWIGGILIGLGIGAIMVFRKPRNQGIFVKTMAIGTLIDAMAQMYSTFFESVSNIWFDLIPELVLLTISVLFWISLKQAKAILWNDDK